MIGQIVEALIAELSEIMPSFSQLPLADTAYPFAVVTETITSKGKPKFSGNFIIDIWDNKLNDTYFDLDTLASNLYNLVVIKNKFFFYGSWEVIQNIPTQEEGLTRHQIRMEVIGWNTTR